MTALLLAGAAAFGLMALSDALCVFARRPAAVVSQAMGKASPKAMAPGKG